MGSLELAFHAFVMVLGIYTSVLGLLVVSTRLPLWLFLVLNTVSICLWLKTKADPSSVIIYFIISVLGSLIFLCSCLGTPLSGTFLQIALLLKLGFPPLHFWVVKLILGLELISLCNFLGPFKLGLLWLYFSNSGASLLLSSFSLPLGLFLLWSSFCPSLILFGSGCCQLLPILLLGPIPGLTYFLFYLVTLWGISLISFKLMSPLLAFLSLGSLPPLSLFWGKVLALSLLPLASSVLVLLISVLSFWPYLRCSLFWVSSCSSSPTLILCSVLFPAATVFTLA